MVVQRQSWSTMPWKPGSGRLDGGKDASARFQWNVDTVNADWRQAMKRKYMQARTCEMMGIHSRNTD